MSSLSFTGETFVHSEASAEEKTQTHFYQADTTKIFPEDHSPPPPRTPRPSLITSLRLKRDGRFSAPLQLEFLQETRKQSCKS